MAKGHPFIKISKRDQAFPLGGDRRSQVYVNDETLEENRRRLHGTDPLKDGWDPGENPLDDRGPRIKKPSGPPVE